MSRPSRMNCSTDNVIFFAKRITDTRGDGYLTFAWDDRNYATQASKPARIFSSGRLRPMNTARLSRFSSARPGPLMVAVQDHVHALEHEALGIVLEREDALAAQDARPVFSDQVLDPGKELVGVERLVGLQRHRLHLFVVIVLETCAMMTMVGAMIAMAMNMMMIVVMVVSLQELRLDVEDAVEVEGVAAEHLVERDFGALGAVQPRVRIEPADARLQLGKFARLTPDRSC